MAEKTPNPDSYQKDNRNQNKGENTHDKLFKQTFSRVEAVRDYITHFLPKELVDGIQLDSLKLDNGEYIDEKLKEHFSDIVYHCLFQTSEKKKAAKSIRIALLLEHKSSPPKRPHLQMLRYMLNIWERDISNKQPPTPVIPIIIYHGKSKWKTRPLHSYFKGLPKALHPYLPDFRYEVTDLNIVTDNEIEPLHKTMLFNTFLLFKHLRHRNRMKEWFALFFDNFDRLERNEALVLFVYLNKNTELRREEILELLTHSPKSKENAMTWIEELLLEKEAKGKAEGEAKGLAKGLAKGEYKKALHVVTQCHVRGLPIEDASFFSGLSAEQVTELYARLDKGEKLLPLE